MTESVNSGPYWLTCAHCKVNFQGTWHQFKHWKYAGSRSYCSRICRRTGTSNRKRKPQLTYGPCPTCESMFESKKAKKFCSMKCYLSSPEYKTNMRSGALASRSARLSLPEHERYNREVRCCLECGTEFTVIPSRTKKFCCSACYRTYMAKRFDRWIASPQRIALPQAYDEFLTLDELPCLVDGCNWSGKHLSGHMNWAHGVVAREFKRAAGFNLHTGVVCLPLHKALVDRAVDYGALGTAALELIDRDKPVKRTRDYHSLERKEHAVKTRALLQTGPIRICEKCAVKFVQSTPFGRAKFCSTDCRNRLYARRNAAKIYALNCGQCGKFFKGTKQQMMRAKSGSDVCCSLKCRGHRNSRLRVWRPPHASASRAAPQDTP
jgi:hypothetical protein